MTLRYLITRTDNIGDVVLSLAFPALLKKKYGADAEIFYLARDYTKDVIEACPHVDHFISDDHLKKMPETDAIALLKNLNIDVFIPLYQDERLARWAYKAKIPHRLGHIYRSYFLRYGNKLLFNFKRKRCELHQAQMGLQYLKALKLDWDYSRQEISELIHLQPTPCPDVDRMLEEKTFHLVVHPGDNGHTINWSKQSFAQLLNILPPTVKVYLSGSSKEKEKFGDLLNQHPNTVDLFGKISLNQYIYFLSKVNGIIVGSTGPLHLASALKTPAIGLFPPHQDLDAKRWGGLSHATLNVEAVPCEHLKKGIRCTDLHNITPHKVLEMMQTRWALPR